MNSPLSRVVLSLLAGYALIMLFLVGRDWMREIYPRPPAVPDESVRIRHPDHHHLALNALKRFSRMGESEKNSLVQNLASGLISVDQWLARLDGSDFRVLCLGEFHTESTRRFLAREFFPDCPMDRLMLEATDKELKRIYGIEATGRDYFPLLGADILGVLRAVAANSPDIRVFGIEETEKGQIRRKNRPPSRDASIAGNFWRRFSPEKRHVILFGALHCSNRPDWLFTYLREDADAGLREKIINVQVLGEHQDGPMEALVFFLDEIGIKKQSFVIRDTGALHPLVGRWFPSLRRRMFTRFSTVMVFRR